MRDREIIELLNRRGEGMKEREMIELLLQKNEKGMDELIIHYGALMRYIIAPILPNKQDQEDCLSKIAMQVWKKIDKFDSQRGSWNAWLTAISRNYALNYKRSNKDYSSIEEIESDISSSDLSPEEQMIRQERLSAVNRALQSMSSQDRTLFYRKYYYFQSISRIASEMGMTERAVEEKLYRIKKQLRKMLGGN